VKTGRFRVDLYYRLKVFPITVPPLRERREDIPPLVSHLIAKHAERMQKPPMGVSGEAMVLLVASNWPGNVRELENVILRMLVVCKGDTLDVADLPEEIRGTSRAQEAKTGDLKGMARETTEMVERRAILEGLEKGNWNVTRTARALGISRASLQNKMKSYGLRRPGK
ncbi:MAG: helix-turn-helix domain-containing protein, partial [Gemmatimonadales bacterium]